MASDMDNHKEKHKDFTHRVENFSGETTMHGIKFIFSPAIPAVKRVMWTVMMLCMVIAFLHIVIQSVLSYYNYDSSTSISITRQSEQSLPAITICNINMAKNSSLQKLLKRIPNSENLTIDITMLLLGQEMRTPTNQFSPVLNYMTFYQLIEEVSFSIDELFVECKVGHQYVNCSKYTTVRYTDKGKCYTFQSDEYVQNNSRLYTKQDGMNSGLTLTLDVHPDEYILPIDLGIGLQVLVHDPLVSPKMQVKQFSVSPGKQVFVAINRIVTQILPRPYSSVDCIKDQDLTKYANESIGVMYSQDGCFSKCFLNTLGCNCELLGNDINACSLYSTFICTTNKYEQYNINGLQCDQCLPTCKLVSFHREISVQDFPNFFAETYAKIQNWPVQDLEEIKRRYVQVKVYFKSLDETLTRQVPATIISDFCANIGGQLGLFLGASVITLMEILLFIGSSAYGICKVGIKKIQPKEMKT